MNQNLKKWWKTIIFLFLVANFSSCNRKDANPELFNENDSAGVFKIRKPKLDSLAEGKRFFENQGCNSCHIMGRKLIGPDLSCVSKRKSHEWQLAFIRNPSDIIQSDPYAQKMRDDMGGVMMASQNISDEAAKYLFKYIDSECK